MKKFLAICVLALILAVAIGYGVKSSMNNNVQLNDLAMANIEALARVESPNEGGRSCYRTITTSETRQVVYCGTCDFIPGNRVWYAITRSC